MLERMQTCGLKHTHTHTHTHTHRATKLMDSYTAGPKEYETIIELGYETTTFDTEGEQVGEVCV